MVIVIANPIIFIVTYGRSKFYFFWTSSIKFVNLPFENSANTEDLFDVHRDYILRRLKEMVLKLWELFKH